MIPARPDDAPCIGQFDPRLAYNAREKQVIEISRQYRPNGIKMVVFQGAGPMFSHKAKCGN